MNAARDLANTGTPGPWTAHQGDLEGGTMLDYVATLLRNRDDGTSTGRLYLTIGRNDIDPENGDTVVPALTGDGPNAEANAVKLVRAVNALPAIADLLDMLDGHEEHCCEFEGHICIVPARLALPHRPRPGCR